MTITKMLKQLKELQEKVGNKVLYEVYDDFLDAFNEVKEGEEKPKFVITIENIIIEFEEKKGQFFETYSITAEFRNYIKWIETGKIQKLHPLFKESKKLYVEKWEKENPGKNYEVELKKQQEARKKEANRTLGRLLPYFYFGGYPFYLNKNI